MKITSPKLLEYSVLLIGVLVFAFLFFYVGNDATLRIVITALAAVFYSLWGIVHHMLEGRFNLEIALEYILISFFVFLLVLTALSI